MVPASGGALILSADLAVTVGAEGLAVDGSLVRLIDMPTPNASVNEANAARMRTRMGLDTVVSIAS
jgi:hypothetical protein